MSDPSGCWPDLSAFFQNVAVSALAVATAAAVVAVTALAVGTVAVVSGPVISVAVAVATTATTIGTQALAVAVGAGAASVVCDEVEKRYTRSYSVYFLEDETGTIQYVGRVTDSGYRARMAYHYYTRGLTPAYRVSGLSYEEARGLEEIGMIECHTLNSSNPVNNQIHGISQKNKNGSLYMKAAIDYLLNRAENWLLDIIS